MRTLLGRKMSRRLFICFGIVAGLSGCTKDSGQVVPAVINGNANPNSTTPVATSPSQNPVPAAPATAQNTLPAPPTPADKWLGQVTVSDTVVTALNNSLAALPATAGFSFIPASQCLQLLVSGSSSQLYFQIATVSCINSQAVSPSFSQRLFTAASDPGYELRADDGVPVGYLELNGVGTYRLFDLCTNAYFGACEYNFTPTGLLQGILRTGGGS